MNQYRIQGQRELPERPGARQGGDYRGLALVRSLGRQSIPVWVIHQREHRLAGTSSYAHRTFFHPHSHDDKGIDFLIQLSRQYDLRDTLLFPTADESVRLISTTFDRLSPWFRLTVPSWTNLEAAVNKRLMHRVADDVGVEHPKTIYPKSREDLASVDLKFPVLLKPVLRDEVNALTMDKVWRADDRTTLLVRYDDACQFLPADMLMVQEIKPGGGECQFSYAAVCSEGESLASLVARRQRQFPLDFGRFSTFLETVDDPSVAEAATKFLLAIRYTGMVEVEFKKDPRSWSAQAARH
jgi:D-aspartate ligase